MSSASSSAPVALEPYASVAAEVAAGRELEASLALEGIEPEAWRAAEAHWRPRVDPTSEKRDVAASVRYAALFEAKRRVASGRLARERGKAGRPPIAAPDLSLVDASREGLDEPLRAELPRLDAPSPPAIATRTEAVHPPPAIAVSTARFADPSPPPLPPPVAPPLVTPPPVTPPPVTPPPVTPPPQPERAAPRKFATMAISLDELAQPAVPFRAAERPRPPSAPPPPAVEAPRPKQDLGATMMPATEPTPGTPMPFRAPLGATAQPSPAQPSPAQPSPAPEPTPQTPRRFAINVFASLTAEIAERPDQIAAIRTRYGVTEAEHRAESERWTAEFAKSDELRQRYLGIVSRYRTYLKKRSEG